MTDGGACGDAARPPMPEVVEVDDEILRRSATLRSVRRRRAAFATFFAVAIPIMLLLAPHSWQQPIGLTQNVTATVAGAVLSDDQPRKAGSQAWDVTLQWTDGHGVVQHGIGRLVVQHTPPLLGQTFAIAVGSSGDISFDSDHKAWVVLLITLGVWVVSVLVAARTLPALRRRSSRPVALPVDESVAAVVIGRGEHPDPRKSRWRPRRCTIDYSTEPPNGHEGRFFVVERFNGRVPAVGDRLQVWADRTGGRSPFLIRRPLDDTWWLGGGPDPIPAIGPPSRG